MIIKNKSDLVHSLSVLFRKHYRDTSEWSSTAIHDYSTYVLVFNRLDNSDFARSVKVESLSQFLAWYPMYATGDVLAWADMLICVKELESCIDKPKHVKQSEPVDPPLLNTHEDALKRCTALFAELYGTDSKNEYDVNGMDPLVYEKYRELYDSIKHPTMAKAHFKRGLEGADTLSEFIRINIRPIKKYPNAELFWSRVLSNLINIENALVMKQKENGRDASWTQNPSDQWSDEQLDVLVKAPNKIKDNRIKVLKYQGTVTGRFPPCPAEVNIGVTHHDLNPPVDPPTPPPFDVLFNAWNAVQHQTCGCTMHSKCMPCTDGLGVSFEIFKTMFNPAHFGVY